MPLLDVTSPLTVLLLLTATVLLIFLGKETKKPIVPAIVLFFFLALLVFHSILLCIPNYAEFYGTIRYCLAFELVMVLVSFLSYLWIDDIASKFYNKKSLDNSLDWFWKQV